MDHPLHRSVPVALAVLILTSACTKAPDASLPSETSVPSAEAIRNGTPDEVAQTLYEAQRSGDRDGAAAVASARVIHILFDPLATQGQDGASLAPGANSLGSGPEPCTEQGHGYACHFRDSSVTVLIRKQGSGYRAWAAMVPLGGGSPEAAARTFLDALERDDAELAATIATARAWKLARAFGVGPWELDEGFFEDVDSACRANDSGGYDCAVAGPGNSYFYLLLSDKGQVYAATLGD